jgi:plastocyanin
MTRTYHASATSLALCFSFLLFAPATTAQVRDVRAHHHSFTDGVRADSTTIVDLGSVVRWTAGGNAPHTVTSGMGSSDPMSGVLFQHTLATAGATFDFVPGTPGVVPYYCQEHEQHGMKGVLIVNPIGLPGHVVHAHHHRFFDGGNGSADVFVELGETIVFRAGHLAPHTITSGTGSSDPNAGALFDSTLLAMGDTFSFTPTSAGDIPYFCREHEIHGMSGTIHVLPNRTYPGTGDDVRLDVGLDAATGLYTPDVLDVAPGSQLNLSLTSPNRTIANAPVVLAFDVFLTGNAPTPLFPGLNFGPSALLVQNLGFFPLSMPREGLSFGFQVPPVPVGVSVLVQPVVLDGGTQNGVFGSGHAIELTY